MYIHIKEENNNLLVFVIRDIDEGVANALRRIIMTEIPIYAIENVRIRKNTSIIPSEMLSHRLGLIPLSNSTETDEKIIFTLRKKLNGTNEIIEITSKDLKSSNKDVKPITDDIIIAKLTGNQEIRLEAIAIKGTSKEHAKWSPVCVVWFKRIEDTEFEYTLESTGSMEPRKILLLALKKFKNNIDKCITEFEKKDE